jgi:hypothetical protein
MLTYAGGGGVVPQEMRVGTKANADICRRMLTYADVCGGGGVVPQEKRVGVLETLVPTYAD